MKLRSKKIMAVLMASAIGTGAFAVSAANLTKNVQLRYNNINVKVDGEHKVPNMEPFFIGDSVYVSLRDAGQLIGSQVNWNGATNTVEINTSTSAHSALEAELAARNHELAVAKSEIQKMQVKIEQYEKELGITDKEDNKQDNGQEDVTVEFAKVLEEALKELEKDYDDRYNIEWDLSLKGDEDKLEFKMSYDSMKFGDEFKDISKANLEKMAKDIMKDIQKECGDIKVEGEIYDKREKVEKATFTMSAKGSFRFEYKGNSEFNAEDLKKYTEFIQNKYDDFPSLNLGGLFDGSSIRVRNMVIKEDDSDLEIEIYTDYANLSIAKRAWSEMDGTTKDKLESYLEDVQDDVETEFDTDATVYVLNESKDVIATYDTRLKLN